MRVEDGPGEVFSIAVEPAQDSGQAHHLVVLDAISGWIMVSSDQGLKWDPVFKPDVMDNTGQLIFTPTDPPTLYAATRTGLRYSPDYGQTWFRVPSDLGYVNVITLETIKEDDRVILYAATPGGYAARTDRGMMSAASLDGLRDSTTLVNPGVYRYTQMPIYTIMATAGENGNITPSGEVIVDGGDDPSFTITVESDYQIADVEVDGVSVYPDEVKDGIYTFIDVQDNHTIHASFEEIPAQGERYYIPLFIQ